MERIFHISEVKTDKKDYLKLLLLADEQEDMIDRYLDRGTMYVLKDNGAEAVCVVTDEGGGILEIKNLAVAPGYQRRGYGRYLIEFLAGRYSGRATACFRSVRGTALLRSPFMKNAGLCGHM